MPIAQLLELWKKIEVEPMEVEVSGEEQGVLSQRLGEPCPQQTERVYSRGLRLSEGRCVRVRVCA